MFDNVEVLPARFEQEYRQCLENNDFIEASQYLVSISKRKYWQLLKKKLVLPLKEVNGSTYIVKLHYDNDLGLLFERDDSDFD